MGNNFRGGYQIIDLSEYDYGQTSLNLSTDEINKIILSIVTTFNLKKPIMIQLKDDAFYDCTYEYYKTEEDFRYLNIKVDNFTIVSISSEEFNIAIKKYTRNKYSSIISFHVNDSHYILEGKVTFNLTEDVLALISQNLGTDELTVEQKKTILLNINGFDGIIFNKDNETHLVMNLYVTKNLNQMTIEYFSVADDEYSTIVIDISSLTYIRCFFTY